MSALQEKVKFFGILMVMKAAYAWIIRPLVVKAIDDPNEAWDDTVMEILDRLFDYKE